MIDSVRRCKECRRVVRGHAGNACPYCGGGELVVVTPGPVEHPRHSTVLTLSVTFALGLAVLYGVVTLMPNVNHSPSYARMLWNLLVTVWISTGFHLVIRRSEGDFRALFMIAFGLFCANEGVGALIRSHGIYALDELGILLSLAMMVYSSLALMAGLADGPSPSIYHRSLMVAAMGFMVLGMLRFYLQISNSISPARMNQFVAVMLGCMVVYQVVLLWRGEQRAKRAATPPPSPGATPPAPPSAQADSDPLLNPDAKS